MQQAINGWIERLQQRALPALDESARLLQRLMADENVGIGELVSVIDSDPGLTVALLRRINAIKHRHLRHEITTVRHALMMMGLGQVQELPRLTPGFDSLEAEPQRRVRLLILDGLHAAAQAWQWARLRKDMDAEEVYVAALLHNLAEMLLWLEAPDEMQRLETLTADGTREPEEAQLVVLGCSLDRLTAELCARWGLPSLISEALHVDRAGNPRVYGIMLAIQLARTARNGWYTAEATARLEQVAEFLNRDFDATVAQVHQTAARSARDSAGFLAPHSAATLILPSSPRAARHVAGENAPSDTFCLVPQPKLFRQAIHILRTRGAGMALRDILQHTVDAMHEAIGLNRVVFSSVERDRRQLLARQIAGSDHDPAFGRFTVDLEGDSLFRRLLTRPQAVWMADQNRERLWPLVPEAFRQVIRTDSFFAVSVFVGEKPAGVFYADRHGEDCALDAEGYQQFKQLAMEAGRAMAARAAASRGRTAGTG